MKYELISLSGPDSTQFLQGQMTQDVEALQNGLSLPSAWCSPKGRVLVTCRLLAMDKRLLMTVPPASSEATLQRLQMYRLRAKVDIRMDSEYACSAFGGATARQLAAAIGMPDDASSWHDAGLSCVRLAGPEPVLEVIARPGALSDAQVDPEQALDDGAWAKRRLAAGLVDIDASNAEKFTPHMLNLDRVGAISFTKGCYTGQEIVARTEHLGKVKRRANLYRCVGGTVKVGDRPEFEGAVIGEVVNAAGDLALAVVPVDRFGTPLTVGQVTLHPEPLPYAVSPDTT